MSEKSAPKRKVLGATGGSVIGYALTTLFINAAEYHGKVDFQLSTEVALSILIVAATTFVGGYLPHSEPEA